MLSIIIPACNEENYLENTIRSIRSQKYNNYEIIVVNDASIDKTLKIAKKLADKVINLTKRQGPAIAKNKGVKIAKGNKLVFLDSDTQLINNVLKNISNILDKYPNIVGTCKIKPQNKRLKHRIMMFLKNHLICPFGVSNGMIFCTKETFNKFHGFNPSFKKKEDGDFVRRIKKQSSFIILDECIVSSTRRFDKKGYVGVGLYWIKEYLKPSDKDYEIIR